MSIPDALAAVRELLAELDRKIAEGHMAAHEDCRRYEEEMHERREMRWRRFSDEYAAMQRYRDELARQTAECMSFDATPQILVKP